jgi:adenosylcobyric acid synthase
VQGTVWGRSDAREYFTHKKELAERVRESYERLAAQFEMIVIEGAGSAAEVNLRDRDLANWAMAELADARVILVADIDRGGVFAQIVGTLDLLTSEERARVIGLIINKFRGDATLFEDGVQFLRTRTGVPVLGVVPMLRDLAVDQEDSVAVERAQQWPFDSTYVNVAVVLLPRMSNFTDFKPVAMEPDVRLRYVEHPEDLIGVDVVILPGTKNTLDDLRAVRQAGFAEALHRHVDSGGELVGICGGYQMLGREITDPSGVESGGVDYGLGFLDVSTVMRPIKTTSLVEAQALHLLDSNAQIHGYYIHMGATSRGKDRPCFQVSRLGDSSCPDDSAGTSLDGAASDDGLVWGTYIHGVFGQAGFRRSWLNRVRRRKGWTELNVDVSDSISQRLNAELDRWADHVGAYLDLTSIFSWITKTSRL